MNTRPIHPLSSESLRQASEPLLQAVDDGAVDACAKAYASALAEALSGSGDVPLTRPEAEVSHWKPEYVGSQYNFVVDGVTYSGSATVETDDEMEPYATAHAWIGRGDEPLLIRFVILSDYSRRLDDTAVASWVRDRLTALAARAKEAVAIVAPVLRHMDEQAQGAGLLNLVIPGANDPTGRIVVDTDEL